MKGTMYQAIGLKIYLKNMDQFYFQLSWWLENASRRIYMLNYKKSFCLQRISMRGEWRSRCAIKVRGIRRPRVEWSAIFFFNFYDNLWWSILFFFQRQWFRLYNSVLRIWIRDFHDFIQQFQVECPTKCAVNGYFTVFRRSFNQIMCKITQFLM